MANACDCAVLYLSDCLDVDVSVSEHLYEIMDICRLLANPGSLLLLLYMSKVVRSEFHSIFAFFWWFNPRVKILPESLFATLERRIVSTNQSD